MLMEKTFGETYHMCRIPGIVLTEQGTLLAYYECRRSASDWADIDLKIIRSTDKGDTWETTLLIPSAGNTMNNPMITVEGETIHFFYCENYKRLFHRVSTDDGRTFSEPVELTAVFDEGGFFYNVIAVGPGHGIVHNGVLLLPVWIGYNREDPKAHHPSFAATIYSQDSGNSWKLGEVIGRELLIDPSECALAVTPDNRVLISIRNVNDCRSRAFALSETGYSGWTDLHFAENMPDPVCMGSMAHTKDAVYHINCATRKGRENLTIKVSRDNFETFEEIFVDNPAGYSDIAVGAEDIFVLYEKDIANDGLYFKRIKR